MRPALSRMSTPPAPTTGCVSGSMRKSSLAWIRQVSICLVPPGCIPSMPRVPALTEALVGAVEMALHRGARTHRVVLDDRVEYQPMLGDRARPEPGIVVVMFQ